MHSQTDKQHKTQQPAAAHIPTALDTTPMITETFAHNSKELDHKNAKRAASNKLA
jgi:hypothetical protein